MEDDEFESGGIESFDMVLEFWRSQSTHFNGLDLRSI